MTTREPGDLPIVCSINPGGASLEEGDMAHLLCLLAKASLDDRSMPVSICHAVTGARDYARLHPLSPPNHHSGKSTFLLRAAGKQHLFVGPTPVQLIEPHL